MKQREHNLDKVSYSLQSKTVLLTHQMKIYQGIHCIQLKALIYIDFLVSVKVQSPVKGLTTHRVFILVLCLS